MGPRISMRVRKAGMEHVGFFVLPNRADIDCLDQEERSAEARRSASRMKAELHPNTTRTVSFLGKRFCPRITASNGICLSSGVATSRHCQGGRGGREYGGIP